MSDFPLFESLRYHPLSGFVAVGVVVLAILVASRRRMLEVGVLPLLTSLTLFSAAVAVLAGLRPTVLMLEAMAKTQRGGVSATTAAMFEGRQLALAGVVALLLVCVVGLVATAKQDPGVMAEFEEPPVLDPRLGDVRLWVNIVLIVESVCIAVVLFLDQFFPAYILGTFGPGPHPSSQAIGATVAWSILMIRALGWASVVVGATGVIAAWRLRILRLSNPEAFKWSRAVLGALLVIGLLTAARNVQQQRIFERVAKTGTLVGDERTTPAAAETRTDVSEPVPIWKVMLD